MKLFLMQLRSELRKLFARRRTYIGYGAFLILELVILWVFHLDKPREEMGKILSDAGLEVDHYYSALTVTYWMLGFSMAMLGAIYLALVSGDIVAKESEDGNLRMVLARPISRLRVLTIKYVAVLIYTLTFVWFVGVSGYLMSSIALGWDGGLFVWNYELRVFSFFPEVTTGIGRLCLAMLLLSLSMCTLSSIGFAFSCLRIKPAAATILALSVLFVDSVLQMLPFMAPYKEHLLTHRMSNWVYVLENHVSWAKLAESYTALIGLDLTLFVLGWMAFRVRDFKT